jgi:hypothetical protein
MPAGFKSNPKRFGFKVLTNETAQLLLILICLTPRNQRLKKG